MTHLVLADVMCNIRDLPPLPIIVTELIGTLGKEDINTGVLAEKLSKDQALSAKTLRLANSSFYGRSNKVSTIGQAIAILGFNSVRTLVTSSAVIANFSANSHPTFNYTGFWRHSIGAALCARILARRLGVNQDHAFMAGLLHDIGRLVLVTGWLREYDEVLSFRKEHDCNLLVAERHILQIDHAMTGGFLASAWKFPPFMQRAIADHHAPSVHDKDTLSAIVHLADCIVHALNLSCDDSDLVPPLSEPVWSKFNLEQAALAIIYRETEDQFEEACKMFLTTKAEP